MENEAPKRQKADIDLEIKLPNVEKPFFKKMSTENNMLTQIKKAGTKLDEHETLDVWVNGNKNIVLSKSDILMDNLKERILDRIHLLGEMQKQDTNREINKGMATTQNPNDIEVNNPEIVKAKIDIVNIGEKTNTSQSFTIHKEPDLYDVNVHLEKEDLNAVNSIVEKLKALKEQGHNYISTEHTDYKVNTYTDAEYYFNETPNDVFYLAKEKEDISSKLDKSSVVSNSETNSEDNIKTAIEYGQMPIDNLIKLFESKEIFLPRELSSTNFVEPSDLKQFANSIEKAVDVHSLNQNTNKNLEFLKDQIKFLGFGEDPKMQKELEIKISTGAKDFQIKIDYEKASFKNEASFALNFNRSESTGNYFLNTFKAILQNAKKDLNIDHVFAVKQNGLTAKQAVNLLEGRSVLATINNPRTKQEEPAFIKLKLNDEKNEKGNYKLEVFNKAHNVDIDKIVVNSKLKFDDEKHKSITIKSLEKGNIVAVKFEQDNEVVKGKAVLNPQYRTLNLYDENMKRVNTNKAVLSNEVDTPTQTQGNYKQSR